MPEVAVAARPPASESPGRLAWRRLRRNRAAMGFLGLFTVIVVACAAAPLWADGVAHTTPSANHLTEQVRLGGEERDVVTPEGIPIGPTWHGRFFLGADPNGRDVMVRLLYGGRTSLLIGFGAALVTVLLATLAGLVAGWFRGWADGLISRLLDVIWAYPVILLGIALGTALALGGLKVGPLTLDGNSPVIPLLIIGLVYIPYLARPVRGQVLSLREREFVDAARTQGAGAWDIMLRELLPNLTTTLVVFTPLIVAQAILLESALSYLGAGVQPPTASWGTMLSDGTRLITSAPHLTIVPGLVVVACVLALNVFGDGVRDALDPRATVRMGR